MGDMLEKILKSLSVPDSELPSPSIPVKSMMSSPSPPPSPRSSTGSNTRREEKLENGYKGKTKMQRTRIDFLFK